MKGEIDGCCGEYCKLTRKQRLYGFAYSFAAGCILGLLVRLAHMYTCVSMRVHACACACTAAPRPFPFPSLLFLFVLISLCGW